MCGKVGGEPDQSAFHVVYQRRPGPFRRPAPGDEYIVATGRSIKGRDDSRCFAQAPLGAIANYGITDPLGAGEADPNDSRAILSIPPLRHDGAACGIERVRGG